MIDQDGMRRETRTELRPEPLGPGTDTVPVLSRKRPRAWQQSDSAWSDQLCRQRGKRRRSTLKTAAPAQIEIVNKEKYALAPALDFILVALTER